MDSIGPPQKLARGVGGITSPRTRRQRARRRAWRPASAPVAAATSATAAEEAHSYRNSVSSPSDSGIERKEAYAVDFTCSTTISARPSCCEGSGRFCALGRRTETTSRCGVSESRTRRRAGLRYSTTSAIRAAGVKSNGCDALRVVGK